MSAAAKPRFDDGKAAEAFRTIGEVAKALAIAPHVLRYWEEQFPMLAPLKRGGRRYYRQDDIRLVEAIDQLVHREGYTLRGARQKLEEDARAGVAAKPANVAPVAQSLTSSAVLARLATIRANLAHALED